jgi:hypothetical protein
MTEGGVLDLLLLVFLAASIARIVWGYFLLAALILVLLDDGEQG